VQVSWYQSDGQLPTVKKALADSALTGDPMVSVYTKQLASSRLLPLVPNWDGETGSGADAQLDRAHRREPRRRTEDAVHDHRRDPAN
jgi:hypothetical protein